MNTVLTNPQKKAIIGFTWRGFADKLPKSMAEKLMAYGLVKPFVKHIRANKTEAWSYRLTKNGKRLGKILLAKEEWYQGYLEEYPHLEELTK